MPRIALLGSQRRENLRGVLARAVSLLLPASFATVEAVAVATAG
jgi:hypothetical protein